MKGLLTRNELKRDLSRAVCWSLLFVFAAHAYAYFNPLFSGDSLSLRLGADREKLTLAGRYLLPVYGALRGELATPLTVGLISCACLAVSVSLIAEMLGIRGRLTLPLACAILTTNAGVTGENLFEFYAADGSFLALLLIVLALYLAARLRGVRRFACALPVCFALGLDTNVLSVAYFLTFASLLLALTDRKDSRIALTNCLWMAAAIAIGALLHAVGYRLLLGRRGLSPVAGATALSSLGALSSPSAAAQAAIYPVASLLAPDTIHPLVCGGLYALLLLYEIWALVALLRKAAAGRIATVCALIALVPLAVNPAGYGAQGNAPARCTWAFYLLPVLALALLERSEPRRPGLRGCAVSLCFLLAVNAIIFSNQLYLKRHLEAQSTLSVMTRVIGRAEREPGFAPGSTPVAVMGDLNGGDVSVQRVGFEHLAAFDGNNYALGTAKDALWYAWTMLGYPFNFVSDYEWAQLMQDSRVQEMPAFPAEGYCQMIDGTLVIRLGPD